MAQRRQNVKPPVEAISGKWWKGVFRERLERGERKEVRVREN